MLPFTPTLAVLAGRGPTEQFSLFSSLIFCFRGIFWALQVTKADAFAEEGEFLDNNCVDPDFSFGEVGLGFRILEVSVGGRT